jgi:malate dehydrogenase (oxaloacetate-decarboxylating)(NADP+)
MTNVSMAVAKAAIESGVARNAIANWDAYEEELKRRLGLDDAIMRAISNKAKSDPKRVVFAEADNYKILKAAQIVREENIAIPILLGNKDVIRKLIEENALDLDGVEIIDILQEPARTKKYAESLYKKRQRKGVTLLDALKFMRDRNYFGASMVEYGEADAMISGLTKDYATTIKPALQVIGTEKGRVAGMYMMMTKHGPVFFGDTTVNVDPTAEELVDLTLLIERAVSKLNIKPRIALLSYSNFGSNEGIVPMKVRKAVEILHATHPEMVVDGELQANFAMNNALLKDNFPFSRLADAPANTLIFPNLESGNIAYKLLQELGGAEAVGPILLGLKKPVHIVQLGSSVREIVNMVTLAVLDAQGKEQENPQKRGLLKRITKK